MRIMSHAVEGQDLNLIIHSSNTKEIKYNSDQSIYKPGLCMSPGIYVTEGFQEVRLKVSWYGSLPKAAKLICWGY